MTSWTYQGRPFTESDAEGFESFVYVITRKSTGRSYIGKKVLWNKRSKPPLKGKSRRRHSKVKSDWPTYWGSNKILLEEISNIGEDDFNREVLRLCSTRGEASYYEAKFQFMKDAILSDDYYNDHIFVRVHRSHLKKKM